MNDNVNSGASIRFDQDRISFMRNAQERKLHMGRKSALFGIVAVLGLAMTLSIAASSQVAATGQSPSGYRLIRTIPVGGDGLWDYMVVDSIARRLYVSHATHVTIMDTDTYAVVGEVPDTQGVVPRQNDYVADLSVKTD